jgi:hypothetical protein
VDELLEERVKQLKEIEERLERLLDYTIDDPAIATHRFRQGIRALRNDVLLMVAEAERQHAAF